MEKTEEKLPNESIAIEKGSVPSNNNEPVETNEEKPSMLKDLDGDKMHVLILFFLYILQGIPLGLKASIPLILTNRDVPYKEQATYSISSYPFSMKILWAPIVDSLFIARFGRRKSWLVPVQYLIGIVMLISSQYVTRLIGDSDDPEETLVPDVASLTAMFFVFNFLAATQDVAVDGWALTMLKPKNVGYASTCNSVGQTTGWCLGYILYTTLDSYGVVTLSQFLLFWGIVFLITTTGIAIFMKEKNTHAVAPESGEEVTQEPDLGIIETYKILWKIIRHPLIPVTALFLLTFGFGFSAAEDITNLKLIEKGVPKEKIAMLAIPMIPVKIGFTLFITRFTVGPRPMNVWLVSFPFRLFFCLAMTLLVYVTPMMILEEGGFPTYYYVIIIAIFALHRVALYAMFVAIMAFFARISDPAIGGTYMTFLNTLTNLGNMWPASFVLWFVDVITYKDCIAKPIEESSPLVFNQNSTLLSTLEDNQCYGTLESKACKEGGGSCSTLTEGYYSLSIACVIIGSLWFVWGWRTMRRLQRVEVADWRVVKKDETELRGDKDVIKEEEKFNFFYCF
eukprot:GFUD01011615.1.p1 GENE.GFUD01011615.1~~GFUD01011615.1.p1  ORF type:complete len:566 (-),score=82.48 GFUD01011615.1:146-1843(-)